MFEAFQNSFLRDDALSADNDGVAPQSALAGWNELIDRFGGGSFGQGLYRVIRGSDLDAWNERVANAFPAFAGRITCFGFDWLGRALAVDAARLEGGEPGVVLFEPGTGEALEIPCSIATFHDEELIDYADAALAGDFHEAWLSNGGSAPRHDQCVGYRKPLFLGGDDDLDNLELSDIDVYWHLMGQLIARAGG